MRARTHFGHLDRRTCLARMSAASSSAERQTIGRRDHRRILGTPSALYHPAWCEPGSACTARRSSVADVDPSPSDAATRLAGRRRLAAIDRAARHADRPSRGASGAVAGPGGPCSPCCAATTRARRAGRAPRRLLDHGRAASRRTSRRGACATGSGTRCSLAAAHGRSPSSTALDYAAVDGFRSCRAGASAAGRGGGRAQPARRPRRGRQGAARCRTAAPTPPSSSSSRSSSASGAQAHDVADPVAAFMAERLAWRPAPHERRVLRRGVYVQSVRERVEKVVVARARLLPSGLAGRDAPCAASRARRRGRCVCSLWALGAAIEDHLRPRSRRHARRGHRAIAGRPSPRAGFPRPSWPASRRVVAALERSPAGAVRARGAPSAASSWWTALDGDLVAVDAHRAPHLARIRDALRRRLQAVSTRADRLALTSPPSPSSPTLFADSLRARAQSHLAGLAPSGKRRLLEASERPRTDDARRSPKPSTPSSRTAPTSTRRMSRSEATTQSAAPPARSELGGSDDEPKASDERRTRAPSRRRRVQDQQDVERDEAEIDSDESAT